MKGTLWGVLLGEAVALPIGVNFAGGRHGEFPTEIMMSLGVSLFGLSTTPVTQSPGTRYLIPLAQLVTTFKRRDPPTTP